MKILLFNTLTEKDKSSAVERLISGSTPSQDFFLMVILAILMASFGLLLDNVTVIIGSMLIAPILYPFLGLSLGIIMSDFNLISRSFYTLIKSAALGIVSAVLVTLLFTTVTGNIESEILTQSKPSIVYAVIAIIAGFAASFALVKPQLSETLPGIAISVALIPPLAAIGIGIAKLEWVTASGSLLLFLTNAAGITFGSMVVFSLMNFYVKRNIAEQSIKKEEKKMEKEKERAERK